MWIFCHELYFLFEQRAFKHFFSFVLMQMCACLKEHMTVHCVLCALFMVYPGSAVFWNRQDCNRQNMQRVQMLGHKCSFPKSHFLDSGRKKSQKVLRQWRQNQRLPFQKLFILPLSWDSLMPITVLLIVSTCDCCFFADFLMAGPLLVTKTTRLNYSKRFGIFS